VVQCLPQMNAQMSAEVGGDNDEESGVDPQVKPLEEKYKRWCIRIDPIFKYDHSVVRNATNTLHICLYIEQVRRLRQENAELREENEKLRKRSAEIDAMGQVFQGDVLAQVMEKCSPTDAEIVDRFMHKHVIIGEYFPKDNIDMGEIVPKHIDDHPKSLT
jgi:regulator of replication initiation timing